MNGFSPNLNNFSPETHNLGVKDVGDQTLMQYRDMVMQQMGQMNETDAMNKALLTARLDKEWAQVAREYKILPKDKKQQMLLWKQHQAYMQGAVDEEGNQIEDPLCVDEKALEEYKKRSLKIAGAE